VAYDNDSDRRKYVTSHIDRFLPVALRKKTEWRAFAANRSLYYPPLGFDVDVASVQAKVLADVTTAKTFLDGEIGTTAVVTGAFAARTPPMLDLNDACKTRPNFLPGDITARVTLATTARRTRITKIVLRALSLNGEFWLAGGTIDGAALREYIDRRLRIVEMMIFHVNTVDTLGREWAVSKTGNVPVWQDGHRNRLFEYPAVDVESNIKELLKQAIPREAIRATRQDNPDVHFATPPANEPEWDWTVQFVEGNVFKMMWDRKPPYPESWPAPTGADATESPPAGQVEANIRLPSAQLRQQWRLSRKDLYTLKFYPDANGLTLAQAITELVRLRQGTTDTRLDFLERNWLNCDHAISILQIEALWLAWRRRVTPTPAQIAHAETVFNQLAVDPPPNPAEIENRYVWLGAMIRSEQGASSGLLDGRNGNKLFRTREVEADKFEIGDHVIFWNSGMYNMIDHGPWRLENAVITDLVEQDDGTVDLAALQLAGHGMSGNTQFYAQTFADAMQALAGLAILSIDRKLQAEPNKIRFTFPECDVIKWSPYPELRAPAPPKPASLGPWWIVYPLTQELARGVRYPLANTVRDAVLALPGAIGIEGSGPTGHRILMGTRASHTSPMQLLDVAAASDFRPFNVDHPTLPLFQHVLFPLMQPRLVSQPGEKAAPVWAKYFKARSAPTTKARLLEQLVFDTALIPGLRNPSGKTWSNGPRIRTVLP